jgi:glycine/D-amino acid oxidase-like deaminating enzyme
MQKFLLNSFEKTMLLAARGVSAFSYPTSFEKLEIDENQSLWASYTPDYRAGEPLRQNIEVDLAIIGGGFTGTSTAYHFSRRYPEKRIALLEAKSLANGASGRNGGMMLNWVYGMGDLSDEMTQRLYQTTSGAMDTIEAIIKQHNLEVSYRRDGSLEVFTNAQRAEAAHAETEHLNQLGIPIQFLDREALRGKIALENVYGAMYDPTEGQINGAQLVRSLRPILVEQGVEIYEQTPVLKVREGSTIILTTAHGEVRAKAIVLATNGYTGKLGYFRKAVFPLHSHVFATAPLTPEQHAELGWGDVSGFANDLNRISYATRTNEGHLVFGGGSNRSYGYLFNNRTAFPGTPDSAKRGFADMQTTMDNYLPGSLNLPVTHRWTGTLAISFRRNCSMGVMGEHRNVFYALGYSGHGVTVANLAGKVLTDIYSGDDEAWRDLPFYQADFSPIPLEPFRWMGYQLFTRVTGRSPRMS